MDKISQMIVVTLRLYTLISLRSKSSTIQPRLSELLSQQEVQVKVQNIRHGINIRTLRRVQLASSLQKEKGYFNPTLVT